MARNHSRQGKAEESCHTEVVGLSRARILEEVERVESAVRAWENSTDEKLFVYFRGRLTRSLGADVENAATTLFELCDTCEVERDAWPLVLAIDEFDDALQNFAERWRMAPDDTDPNGGQALWAAYNRMIKAKSPPRQHKLEPISQLLAEGVNRQQICKMYGWMRSDGTPDADKLQEEILRPGTHYDPKKFVHPRDQKFWHEIGQRWKGREDSFRAEIERETAKAIKREASESLEELIISGVNAQQIAKMKGVDVEEVRRVAAEMGVALDSGSIVYASYAEAQRAIAGQRQANLQREMQLAKLNKHAELGVNRDARIMAMHRDGVPPQDIAAGLKHEFPNMTYQDVAATIRRALGASLPVNGAASAPSESETTPANEVASL